REMLLGRAETSAAAPQHGNPSPSRPVPAASSRTRRRWLFAAGGLLTSGLAVVLAVVMLDGRHESAESTVFHAAETAHDSGGSQSGPSGESGWVGNDAAFSDSNG